MNDFEIQKTAAEANIKITCDDSILKIRHQVSWKDKSLWGPFIFVLLGTMFVVMSFIESSNAASKITGILLGFVLLAVSLLKISKIFYDGILIFDKKISVYYNLKKITKPLRSSTTVQMQTGVKTITRSRTISTDFIVITFFLQDVNIQIPVFYFQMEDKYQEKALALGNELLKIINKKCREVN